MSLDLRSGYGGSGSDNGIVGTLLVSLCDVSQRKADL